MGGERLKKGQNKIFKELITGKQTYIRSLRCVLRQGEMLGGYYRGRQGALKAGHWSTVGCWN